MLYVVIVLYNAVHVVCCFSEMDSKLGDTQCDIMGQFFPLLMSVRVGIVRFTHSVKPGFTQFP